MTSHVDLDDLDALARIDSEDVLGAVERFAEQCREGWDIGRAASDLPDADGVDSVVVLGMGGSGVSGDVIQAVIEPRLAVPLRVIKSYGPLPEWVGRNTLVFAVSYSGSTEETVAALEEARTRGVRAVTVSSGGPLAEIAQRDGLAHIQIPAGLQPRASLGYLTLPILAALIKVGLVPEMQDDVDEAVGVLSDLQERCHRKRSRIENPAKDLAARIVGRIPVVYGGYGLAATAAYRFKCDLNEYGKTPAFWNVLPELNHNEVVGWNQLADVTRRNVVLILLRSSGAEHDRISLRFEITRTLIEDQFADVIELPAEGRSPLAQLLSLVLITQLASIYVGLAYGIDPGPVEVIQKLKAELSNR
ncbi:MAG: bifunctional phosphoglucose/phosphomannose isomerase [Actinomycetota bacterium]|nr:bifunctional phosphoglucose/phosphomannose isomerase [Actinomycetota bacterium]